MGAFLLRRLLWAFPTLVGVIAVSFFVVRLAPGSPFAAERALPAATRAALEHRYGLDRPLLAQLGAYLAGAARGDLGPSIRYPEHSVASLVANAWPHTALLAAGALAWAMLLAVPLALAMALWPRNALGRLAAGLCAWSLGTPSFVLAPLLSLALAGPGKLPPAGWGEPVHLLLPCLTLGTVLAGGFARVAARGLEQALTSDYVRLARAKGVPFCTILVRHAPWAALGPLFAYAGPSLAGLLTGSVAVEQLFGVPGLGPYFVDAAQNRDYFLIMGIVWVDAALLIGANLMADVALLWSDPRLLARARQRGL